MNMIITLKPERFPSKPYIREGYPRNVTCLENTTYVVFECPPTADLEPHMTWYKTPLALVEGVNETLLKNLTIFGELLQVP